MNKYRNLKNLIDDASVVLVIQGENPDGDSLSSSLALEEILSEYGKTVKMYCPINIPNHLRHLTGWDRVESDLPSNFDLSIVVDTSSLTLLQKVFTKTQSPKIKSKPLIVLDHHNSKSDIDFAAELVVEEAMVATGELIYDVFSSLDMNLTLAAKEFIASSIMYDSLGLSSEGTTVNSIRIIADLVEGGISLAKLENARRKLMVRALEITHYKGKLLQRIELLLDSQLAYIHIPWEEIQQYSHQYNPSNLVIEDMRLTAGVKLAVAIKTYPDGKITGKLRTNFEQPIAAKVAEKFGGGGHPYAAGFKVRNLSLDEVSQKLQQYIKEALDETS